MVLSVVAIPRLPTLVVVAMMTSNTAGLKVPHDVALKDWSKAGLPKETTVRIAKLVTLEASLILKTIGHLAPSDQKDIRRSLRSLPRGAL